MTAPNTNEQWISVLGTDVSQKFTDYDLMGWLISNKASAELIDQVILCAQDYGIEEITYPDFHREILAYVISSSFLTQAQSIGLWYLIKEDCPNAFEFEYMWDAWNELLQNRNTDEAVIAEIAVLLIKFADDGHEEWNDGFWELGYEGLIRNSVLDEEIRQVLMLKNAQFSLLKEV